MSLNFTTEGFISKLQVFLRGCHLSTTPTSDDNNITLDDWEHVGRQALAKSRRVPISTFMNGPISNSNAASVQYPAEYDLLAPPISKPLLSDNQPDEHAQAVIEEMLGILTCTGPLNFFWFIVNPTSFGQSIENLYYMSFLIQDGLCAVAKSVHGEPIVSVVDVCPEDDIESYNNQHQII
ncbi:hypothetical protein CY34DRAFT_14984 [Suillus luteus UH-Slu-Lm8-n1]|uniref:Non-structural maintenance of chromosomes element 4 n=1 Tax=Suillus luteus UH-Slu-Lm8-n1 TaxID=930992 RepID=A0A0D0AKC1_9AGAM|nr:hypothetical protein CY34DRAFT_14984 [Suillus luteus UH-Slu-Lm8-n1]